MVSYDPCTERTVGDSRADRAAASRQFDNPTVVVTLRMQPGDFVYYIDLSQAAKDIAFTYGMLQIFRTANTAPCCHA